MPGRSDRHNLKTHIPIRMTGSGIRRRGEVNKDLLKTGCYQTATISESASSKPKAKAKKKVAKKVAKKKAVKK
jgi:hypothetical protein